MHMSSLLQPNTWLRTLLTCSTDPDNNGYTMINRKFARQLGYVDMDGNPTQARPFKLAVQDVESGAQETVTGINV